MIKGISEVGFLPATQALSIASKVNEKLKSVSGVQTDFPGIIKMAKLKPINFKHRFRKLVKGKLLLCKLTFLFRFDLKHCTANMQKPKMELILIGFDTWFSFQSQKSQKSNH